MLTRAWRAERVVPGRPRSPLRSCERVGDSFSNKAPTTRPAHGKDTVPLIHFGQVGDRTGYLRAQDLAVTLAQTLQSRAQGGRMHPQLGGELLLVRRRFRAADQQRFDGVYPFFLALRDHRRVQLPPCTVQQRGSPGVIVRRTRVGITARAQGRLGFLVMLLQRDDLPAAARLRAVARSCSFAKKFCSEPSRKVRSRPFSRSARARVFCSSRLTKNACTRSWALAGGWPWRRRNV